MRCFRVALAVGSLLVQIAGSLHGNDARLSRVDVHSDPLPPDAVSRLGTLRLRHSFPITALELSPHGRVVAADDSSVIHVWDARTGREQYQLRDPTSQLGIRTLVFSPDGKTLSTINDFGAVRRWRLDTRKIIISWGGDKFPLAVAQFSRDGEVVASFSHESEEIYLREVKTSKELATWKVGKNFGNHLIFSPNGKTLALGYRDSRLRLMDVETGAERAVVRRNFPKEKVSSSVTFTADSRRFLTPGDKKTIRVYDTATGRLLHTWPSPEQVYSLVCLPDGKTLVTGSFDGPPRLWDLGTGKPLRTWNVGGAISLSRDSKRAASIARGRAIQIWDMTRLEALHPEFGSLSSLKALAFASDGQTLAAAGEWDRDVLLWNATNGKLMRRLAEDISGIKTLAFDANGKTLIGADFSAIHLWALSGQRLYRYPRKPAGYSGLDLSPDGKLLAESDDKGTILWDTATGKMIRRLAISSWSRHFAFSPDGKVLAAPSARQTGDPQAVTLWDLASGKELRRLDVKGPTALAFSGDGLSLAVGTGKGVELWTVATGKRRRRLPIDGEVRALAFSSDGRALASASSSPFEDEEKDQLLLWELASGRVRHEYAPPRGGAYALAFSPDGRLLASGNADTTVLLWDAVSPGSARALQLLKQATKAELWALLDSADARRALQAIEVLADRPAPALAFLRKRLQPVPVLDARRRERLLSDLDGDSFEVRNRAATELEHCADLAEPALRKLKAGSISVALRRQVERLLAGLENGTLPTGHVQHVRALEVVERLKGPEAKALLQQLAAGAPEARLTQEAKKLLRRLEDTRP